MTAEEAVETLFNGNLKDFKHWARYSTKCEVLEAVKILAQKPEYDVEIAIGLVQRLLTN